MATLLVIDDCEAARAGILRALDDAGLFRRTVQAGDGVSGLKLLLSEQPDMVVCDLEMPGLDGEKLLAVKESRPEVRDRPLIFLTASTDLERRVRLLDRGASDLLLKPFHPAELMARVRLHMRIKRLQDELREKNEILSRLSTTDGLTGLRNRRFVDDLLNVEVLRARRYGSQLAVLMADVDHFKRVNDAYGHPAGDQVLRQLAEILRTRLRGSDVAGRYGGEEFLVILAHNTLEGARLLGERWRQDFAEQRFDLPDGRSFACTLSVGSAGFDPELHASAADLVAAADAALYEAKAAGRDRVC